MGKFDPLTRWRRIMHADRFRATGRDFEKYVSEALRYYHTDFVNPEPVGPWGDGGSDGIAVRGSVLYACYGTERGTGAEAELARKIHSDFNRAVASYSDFVEWRFVTNAVIGPKASSALIAIQREHGPDSVRSVTAVIWGADHFWDEILSALPESRLEALFGVPPTMHRLVPRQLRPRGHEFVNRRRELLALDGVIDRATVAGRPAVALLHGGHGAGKTAIGEHWASQNADRFTSGQILVDFGEMRRAGTVSPGGVLGAVLSDLGYAAGEIPEGLERRSAFYRSVTAQAHRDLLVILDDVETSAQVRPLIPNSPTSAVVVTTRARLETLFLDDVVEAIEIERLDPDKAEHLLDRLLGFDRVEAERAAVKMLLNFCDGLPLAITIVAARLRVDEAYRIADVVTALEAESTRLRRLGVRDGLSLDAVWDDAYRQLSADEARAYRRLGQHPALSFTLESAAAALETDSGTTVELLDALRGRHLLESTPGEPRRFRYHDLLRLHARRTGDGVDGMDGRAQVAGRVAAHYVALCGALDRSITSERLRLALAPVPSGQVWPDPARARASFQVERSSILAVLEAARAFDLNEKVWPIAESLWPLYKGQGLGDEAARVFTLGADAATADGRLDAAARLWALVARMRLEVGDREEALVALACAWEAFGSGTDTRVEGMLCETSGIVHLVGGDPLSALEMFSRARRLCAEHGSRRGVAIQDYLIGRAHSDSGELDLAVAALSAASTAVEDLHDGVLLARVLFHFAGVLERTGRVSDAVASYERSVELAALAGDPGYEARANEALGDLAQRHGDAPGARTFFLRGADLLRLLDTERALHLERRARLVTG